MADDGKVSRQHEIQMASAPAIKYKPASGILEHLPDSNGSQATTAFGPLTVTAVYRSDDRVETMETRRRDGQMYHSRHVWRRESDLHRVQYSAFCQQWIAVAMAALVGRE